MTIMRMLGGALVAAVVLVPVAQAETTVSTSTDPRAATEAVASLLGAESSAMAALPDQVLAPRKPRAAKQSKVAPFRPDAAWLAAQPQAKGGADWACLTKAIYFEARGEPVAGQVAVAEVVMNRAVSGLYPRSICGVVGQRGGGGCQFSFVCDGRSDAIGDGASYRMAGKIAAAMLAGAPRVLTNGATHFHTRAVRPDWARRFPRTAIIGGHLFYRQPGAQPAVVVQ